MNKLTREIGGYFELELNQQQCNNFDSAVMLNSARNCLRYIIKAYNINEIYLPFYTCPIVWQSVQKENCKIKFYHIDENFYPVQNFPENAYILYTNYFGINAKNVKKLAAIYKNLIIDNAQAFYMPKYGIASFNSIRKFFGVPDGAFLYCDKKLDTMFEQDISYQRFSHLLKRIDVNAQFGYDDFCRNEDSFEGENIKIMSKLTQAVISSIDTEIVRQKRIENFNTLDSFLKRTNKLNFELDKDDVPMSYPYMIDNAAFLRNKLIENKIYIPIYWNNLEEESVEYNLRNNIIHIPLDQRYKNDDMNRILEVING